MKTRSWMGLTVCGLLLLAIAFSGCLGGDSEEDKFVGTWMFEIVEDEETFRIYITFRSDGTGYMQMWQDEQENFNWRVIEEGKLETKDDDDTNVVEYRFDGSDTVYITNTDYPDEEMRFVRVDPSDVDLPEKPDWMD